MSKAKCGPLAGVRIVEVAMWAFVPAAGGMLADMGADVIKVEPPTGDPLRGLTTALGGEAGAAAMIDYSWESYNRGKRSITLDLKQEAGREALYRLVEQADVFLTNLLPRARDSMHIDMASLRARNPDLIYAVGSAVGQRGPEGGRGGYDAISFWARGGIASTITPDEADYPTGPVGPAFGDTLSGAMLAGGVAAAIAQRALTGEATEVDVSLLNGAMWPMQRLISQAVASGVDRFPRAAAPLPNNVLVHNYRTADGRWLALCMLQADKYWHNLMELCGRPDLARDPRFVDSAARKANLEAAYAALRELFASRTLAEWQNILARQEGQWDIVQHVGELKDDRQVEANAYLQEVMTSAGVPVSLVSTPMQFGGHALSARPAPELGADSDAVLADLGYSQDEIIALKVEGVVF